MHPSQGIICITFLWKHGYTYVLCLEWLFPHTNLRQSKLFNYSFFNRHCHHPYLKYLYWHTWIVRSYTFYCLINTSICYILYLFPFNISSTGTQNITPVFINTQPSGNYTFYCIILTTIYFVKKCRFSITILLQYILSNEYLFIVIGIAINSRHLGWLLWTGFSIPPGTRFEALCPCL